MSARLASWRSTTNARSPKVLIQQAKDKRNQKTLSNLFQEDYLPYLQSRNRSWKTDEHRFRNHLRPIFGNLIPEEITVTRIRTCNRCCSNASPRPPAIAFALLKAIMTWAARAGLIKENPAALVSLLRENNRRERYFTPDEIRRLFRAADQHESFYTGQYVKMFTAHRLAPGRAGKGPNGSTTTRRTRPYTFHTPERP